MEHSEINFKLWIDLKQISWSSRNAKILLNQLKHSKTGPGTIYGKERARIRA